MKDYLHKIQAQQWNPGVVIDGVLECQIEDAGGPGMAFGQIIQGQFGLDKRQVQPGDWVCKDPADEGLLSVIPNAIFQKRFLYQAAPKITVQVIKEEPKKKAQAPDGEE